MKHRGKLPKGLFYPKGTEVLYIRFTNEFGKQVAESSKGNEKEVAEALLIRRKKEVLARKSPVAAAILEELTAKSKTFQRFLKEDYYPSIEGTKSCKTRKYTLDKFAKFQVDKNSPPLGDLLVRDINISHLLQYRNSQKVKTKELDKDGEPILEKASNGTQNRHRSWILSSLSYAVTISLFHKNILKSIMEDENYPKLTELARNPRAYSLEHLHAILTCSEKRDRELYQIVRFAIATGMRKGQILDFKWTQIAWDKNEISCPPKSSKSTEWLVQPISEGVRTVLEERKEVRLKGLAYVFYNPKTKYRWNNKNKTWWHVLEDAGLRQRSDKHSIGSRERKNQKLVAQGLEPLPDLATSDLDFDAVFHGLRHSFGSHLNDMNIPIITCMLLLGHSNIRTTEKYLKSLHGVQQYKPALDKMSDKLLDHKPEPTPEWQEEHLKWEAEQSVVVEVQDDSEFESPDGDGIPF
jgi:integrase